MSTPTPHTSDAELEQILAAAAVAAPLWAATPPTERATALIAIADALDAAAGELIPIGMRETGLAQARLTGELKRTTVQLRLFADVIRDGSYLDVRLDEADPDFVLGPRPDVRRMLVPVGVAVNFSASNFPFAFSVAGGDSAAALAAGCALIVKGHSGHPELSVATARVVEGALRECGAPDGVFALVIGQQAGVTVLEDNRVDVGTFTGSIRVGRLLADKAAARPRPIQFYGELGSVNPVFVTGAALAERGEEIAAGYAASVAGSAGQLCTKPGFLWVPATDAAAELQLRVSQAAEQAPEHRLLNPSIGRAYLERRADVLDADGVRVVAEGAVRSDDDGNVWATPTIVAVPASKLAAGDETLLDEVFGPFSVIVEYEDETSLAPSLDELYVGNLTGTVHAAAGEQSPALSALVAGLARKTGRVLFGGWPTGVAVTPAMQHGGPYPATSNDTSTSVGTASISRFLRGVAYQGAPQEALPEPLQDANPWGVPQQRAAAGQSATWGAQG
ncbi:MULTISPECIES: aldehyde dehydrogenase family protein [unclassified Pseudoclavibacter]|uniref:aldehyde dehydrogenase family protein n=1 Tax=unclassified Pseudoclavibacter TaxID=2615177 RepID=UPI000CE8D3C3|nr:MULTISPECIES: aldehyde dehydrogenase family protein [unclassified Pseudoclavibacter]MBF4550216.1 aldehyde dehydrogenase family protein [Pseudoclavibacter sp. VKM Ac-2888]PPG03638.1 aldehyde dehydrogenase (NADP(+)) [Pseudoclavibacter sp. RFBI5]